VDDQLQVARPEPQATFYTVQPGDTLSTIAQQHYGYTNQYPRIFGANRPLLKDPDAIYPGQTLRLPR
jgi:nucleoid-associated protein YgaU